MNPYTPRYPGQQWPQQPSPYPPSTQQYPPPSMNAPYPSQYPPTTSASPYPYPTPSSAPVQFMPPPTGAQQYPPPTAPYHNTSPYPPPTATHAPTFSPNSLGWGATFYNQITTQQMASHQALFMAADRDRSGTISIVELANMPFWGRTIGVTNAKILMKVFDKDRSGTIDFHEFATLYQFLTTMANAFQMADADRSGYLDYQEIHNALSGAGFQLTMSTVQEVCAGFPSVHSGMRGAGISFDQFMQICSRLAAVRSIFEWNDLNRSGRVSFNYDQLSQIVFNQLNN